LLVQDSTADVHGAARRSVHPGEQLRQRGLAGAAGRPPVVREPQSGHAVRHGAKPQLDPAALV
jgi:hypothetical protein